MGSHGWFSVLGTASFHPHNSPVQSQRFCSRSGCGPEGFKVCDNLPKVTQLVDGRGGHSQTPGPSFKVGIEWHKERTVIYNSKNLAMIGVPLTQWNGSKDCTGSGKVSHLL